MIPVICDQSRLSAWRVTVDNSLLYLRFEFEIFFASATIEVIEVSYSSNCTLSCEEWDRHLEELHCLLDAKDS